MTAAKFDEDVAISWKVDLLMPRGKLELKKWGPTFYVKTSPIQRLKN